MSAAWSTAAWSDACAIFGVIVSVTGWACWLSAPFAASQGECRQIYGLANLLIGGGAAAAAVGCLLGRSYPMVIITGAIACLFLRDWWQGPLVPGWARKLAAALNPHRRKAVPAHPERR